MASRPGSSSGSVRFLENPSEQARDGFGHGIPGETGNTLDDVREQREVAVEATIGEGGAARGTRDAHEPTHPQVRAREDVAERAERFLLLAGCEPGQVVVVEGAAALAHAAGEQLADEASP